MGNRARMVFLYVWLLPLLSGGQSQVRCDTIALTNLNHAGMPGTPIVNFSITQDFAFSFTASNLFFANWQRGKSKCQVSLLQNIRYRSKFINKGNFVIYNTFVHILGVNLFFDSISCFQPDENTLDTRIEIRILKNITFNVLSNLTTRLFNAYQYSSDQSGNNLKTLNASFLTPMLCTFSAGFGFTVTGLGKLNLGLTSAKLTVVSNKAIYTEMGVTDFYGVPKSKNHRFEYGLSLQVLIDKDMLKRVHWNCDLLIFKNYQRPVDLVLKNFIGIKITKYLKTCIQTRLFYEREVSKNVQLENVLSLGFYFDH